jgi:glycosyltransferase involved in cell wall biosynthesis
VVRRLVFAVPGVLTTPTGGYAYDRRIIAELHGLGWQVDLLDLGPGFPRPQLATRASAEARLAALPPGRPVVVDGLALGVMPGLAEQLATTHRLIALVHHPLACECGLAPDEAATLRRSERRALSQVRRVIVTSPSTARLLASSYGVPAGRIKVAPPGSDRVAPARGSRDATVSLLSVGAVVPRKGYDVLLAALAMLADLPWRLTLVGDRTRDPATAQRLDEQIGRLGLAGRVTATGAVASERIDQLYDEADIFVLASRHEGYGMAFAEAIAYGLPVVGTRAGALPETVPADASLLVPIDDPSALAAALRQLIEDPALRRRVATAAQTAAAGLPAWRHAAELFADAIEVE